MQFIDDNRSTMPTGRFVLPIVVTVSILAISFTLDGWQEAKAFQNGNAAKSEIGNAPVNASSKQSPDNAPEEFAPVRVLPKMRPITDFAVINAIEATETVSEDEMILGVEIDGAARAYPLNMINGPFREILNDDVGGKVIAVTWCFLCHNGIVYSRDVQGEVLTFSVSGLLWKRNLVMIDEESESLWSHMLGRSMQGELEGTVLERLPSKMTTWKKWKSQHPQTTVAILRRTSHRFQGDFYKTPQRFVIGFENKSKARAWGFADLMKQPVINEVVDGIPVLISFDQESYTAALFNRTVDGQTLTFEKRDKQLIDRETGRVWDPLSGKQVGTHESLTRLNRLPGVVSFAAAWKRFYPHSTFWGANIDYGTADATEAPQ